MLHSFELDLRLPELENRRIRGEGWYLNAFSYQGAIQRFALRLRETYPRLKTMKVRELRKTIASSVKALGPAK